jgi:alkanesulfonate monooxygenase SsuD/methylene tetrahydromethanopterin reductase-like flavin-dependent oxidoreductase (luciferase family)
VSLEIDGFVAATGASYRRLERRVRFDRPSEDIDRVLTRALAGSPSAVADQLQRLRAAGADQLVVALHDPHHPEAVDALATAADLAGHLN